MLSLRRCPFCVLSETFACIVDIELLPHLSGSLFHRVQETKRISSSGALYAHDEYRLHTAGDTHCDQGGPTENFASTPWIYSSSSGAVISYSTPYSWLHILNAPTSRSWMCFQSICFPFLPCLVSFVLYLTLPCLVVYSFFFFVRVLFLALSTLIT